jgi:GH24 family phage-related lysozyme (muramidase)
MRISQSAFDLIVAEEVTSKAYYIKHYQRPEWPGASSGVTIGIGYDLGYATVEKIRADWRAFVSIEMLGVMCQCAGVRGDKAKALLGSVKSQITIPWAAALDVFANRDIPNWTALVIQHIPEAKDLTPTCLGALVSLAYNRGASFDNQGDRYAEMRSIKRHVQSGNLIAVGDDLRAMKRLWPTLAGLRGRRDREAALWERGLKVIEAPAKEVLPTSSKATPDPDVPTDPGPARTKPPATTIAQNGATGAVIGGGAVAAQQAYAHGLITTETALFVGFLAALAGATAWWVWYRNRNPK